MKEVTGFIEKLTILWKVYTIITIITIECLTRYKPHFVDLVQWHYFADLFAFYSKSMISYEDKALYSGDRAMPPF